MVVSRQSLGLLLLAQCCFVSASAALLLNIDCGTTGTYVDQLGMTWVGDDQYTPTGQNANVRIASSLIRPLTTLRCFPTGKKNCYTFPDIGHGNKILVRAWFYYGNYDGLSYPPAFDLQFDGSLWSHVITSMNESVIFEMIYVTKVDNVSICVAQTKPNNVPFISSLELRKLDPKMYSVMDTDYALYTKGRYAYGSSEVVRYPNDPYDRLWLAMQNYIRLGLTSLTSSSDPMTSGLDDQPPAAALRQAITPLSNLASNLTIPSPIESSLSLAFYVNFYFVEVSPNSTRSFTLHLDNQQFYKKSIVPSSVVLEIYNPRHNFTSNSVFTLLRDKNSTLPPIINAAEFLLIGNWVANGTGSLDVKALSELQRNYVQLQAWTGDPCLPAGYTWEWLNCSFDATPRITALYLSGFGLNGSLIDFSALNALQIIDLHNNSLSGHIPDFLGKFPYLRELNLADNHFSESLPPSLINNSKIKINITGNSISNNTTRYRKKTNVGLIAGGTLGLLLLLTMLGGAFYIFYCQRGSINAIGQSDNTKPRSFLDSGTNHSFTFDEIQDITNNFAQVIGGGGSGNVYYGQLKNGTEVAVKVLNKSLPHGTKEFVTEVRLLMTVHHKCLASFVGYCEEGKNMILLYEYMSGGNLREILSGKNSTPSLLTWKKRLQIALNVATGLDYLHSGCHGPIIHRDVKSTNILLNEKLEAKVADFGLSKTGLNDDMTHVSTVIAGTPGYIDPEYYGTNMLTKKSDVYSFGVVLFELMSGYPPIFAICEERFHIVQWAIPKLKKGDIHNVADPRLRGQYNVNSMWKVADIAISCTAQTSNSRPTMNDVMNQLKEAIEAESGQDKNGLSFTKFAPESTSSTEMLRSHGSLLSTPQAR